MASGIRKAQAHPLLDYLNGNRWIVRRRGYLEYSSTDNTIGMSIDWVDWWGVVGLRKRRSDGRSAVGAHSADKEHVTTRNFKDTCVANIVIR